MFSLLGRQKFSLLRRSIWIIIEYKKVVIREQKKGDDVVITKHGTVFINEVMVY